MGAATSPPSKFARIEYDVPPPLPDEMEYIERASLILDDPELGLEPPPPTPTNFLEPPPQELLNLKPAAASAAHALPVLNLPLQASLRMPPDDKASPSPSQSAPEAWIMRPAIDAGNRPEQQAESSSMSSPLPSNAANDLANETRFSTVSGDGVTPNKKPNPQSGNQEETNEVTSRMASLSQVASEPPPRWLTDIINSRNRGSPLKPPLVASEVSTPATSMFAPAAAGLTFQIWRNGIPSSPTTLRASALRASAPSARSAALTQPRGGLGGQTSAGAILPPQPKASTPLPSPRSAALMPPATGSPLKPNVSSAEPSSMAADQAKPRKKPSVTKPVPSGQAARDPSGTPPPNPQ
jgi:hypothetical protein